MDTRSLAVVRAILSEGSFQKAAQRLNCSQSTVTFQVRQLEGELSFRLFERIGRRMVLTREGRAVLPHMDAILHSVQAIMDCGDRREPGGELRIAVAESLLSYRIHRLLGDFVRRAPRVRLELHSLNCHDIRDGLLSGDYDLGVYYDVGGHPGTLEVLPLGRVEGVLVASPDLAPELRDLDSPGRELPVSLVINEPRSIFRERVEGWLRARNILLRNTMELWSVEAIKKSVASNLGISFLPRFAVERELSAGELTVLPTAMPNRFVTPICVRHRNREPGPAMLLFRQTLMEAQLFGHPEA